MIQAVTSHDVRIQVEVQFEICRDALPVAGPGRAQGRRRNRRPRLRFGPGFREIFRIQAVTVAVTFTELNLKFKSRSPGRRRRR